MTAYLSANKNADYHRINENSWDGIWYPADGSKEKIMIVVSGSDGGLEHAGKHAHFLADKWRTSSGSCLVQDKTYRERS